MRAIAREQGLDGDVVVNSPRGTVAVRMARRKAMWIFHNMVEGRTYSETGRAFDRDRTTVRHGVKAWEEGIAREPGISRHQANAMLLELGLEAG